MNRREFIGAGSGLGVALVMPPFATLWASELPSDLTAMTASQLSVAIQQRKVSCREVMLAYLARSGSIVEPCAPDFQLPRLWDTWLTLRHWSANWARPLYDDPARRKLLKPEVVFEVDGSLGLTAERVYAAGIARADWFRALGKLFEDYDFLALPTAQVFPFPKGVHWPSRINERDMDTYHRWMEVVIGGTLAGLPIVNVPVGFDPRGRPMGMQLVGPFGEDQRVLELALAYEQVTSFLHHRPPM